MNTIQRLFLIAAFAGSTMVQAQALKPITLLVPFPPGGATDQLARVVAQKMTERYGRSVTVDNRPGAGAQIAVNALMQGPADGSVLIMGDIGAFSLNQNLYQKLSYNTAHDLQPVSLVGKAPLFLMVPNASPHKTVADLLAVGRATELSYASPGVGTGAHVAAEMLRSRTEMRLVHVPYRGASPALVDLAAGHVSFLFDPFASSAPFIKDERIRAIAAATPQRSKLMPGVPTLAESGVEGVNFVAWFGLAVKAGTPADVVQRLNRQIAESVSTADVVARFAEIGIEISTSTPEEFEQLIASDANSYAPVIQKLDIKLD